MPAGIGLLVAQPLATALARIKSVKLANSDFMGISK